LTALIFLIIFSVMNQTSKRILRTLLTICLGFPLALTIGGKSSAEDLGSTDFNIALNLAGLAQGSVSIGALNCSDGSRTFSSSGEMFLGLATDTRVRSQLNLACNPTLNIDSGIKTISGTMTVPSKGITDGVFTAECSAKSSMAVNANIAVGAAVAGLISLNVTSASAPLAFGCTFKGSSASKGTEVFGTIDGYADVAGMCSSACVAISMTARASVTAATGEFKGQSGSGTYTYSDAFEVPELASVADRLAQMKGSPRVRDERVSCPEGATDCTAYSSNPCPNGEDTCSFTKGGQTNGIQCPEGAVCTIVSPPNTVTSSRYTKLALSRPTSTMRINLLNQPGQVMVVRPMPLTNGSIATLAGNQLISISGAPNATCSVVLKAKKTVRRNITLDTSGSSSFTYTAAQLKTLATQLGIPRSAKTKTFNISAICSGNSPSATRTIKIG
jgi:hypothetical protein